MAGTQGSQRVDPSAQPRRRDLSDLQRLIRYVEERRAQLSTAAGGVFDRRAIDATILLGKMWVAVMDLRLQQA